MRQWGVRGAQSLSSHGSLPPAASLPPRDGFLLSSPRCLGVFLGGAARWPFPSPWAGSTQVSLVGNSAVSSYPPDPSTKPSPTPILDPANCVAPGCVGWLLASTVGSFWTKIILLMLYGLELAVWPIICTLYWSNPKVILQEKCCFACPGHSHDSPPTHERDGHRSRWEVWVGTSVFTVHLLCSLICQECGSTFDNQHRPTRAKNITGNVSPNNFYQEPS